MPPPEMVATRPIRAQWRRGGGEWGTGVEPAGHGCGPSAIPDLPGDAVRADVVATLRLAVAAALE